MSRRIPFDIEFLLESLTNVPISNSVKPDEKMLQEDPDTVEIGDESIHFDDGHNVAFFATKTYNLLGPGLMHDELMRCIKHIYRNNDRSLDMFNREGIRVVGEEALYKDVFEEGGLLFKYFNDYVSVRYRNGIDGFLTGRLWSDRKILSFWNEQRKVINDWDIVEKMFLDNKHAIGDLTEYLVDWVERRDSDTPLTPASNISSTPNSTETNQSDFFGKLFTSPVLLDRLSPEQLKKIVDKLHILDPEVKAQIMKANGGLINKSAEIAGKLGMSVAEFNSIWHMDEAKLNESPDKSSVSNSQLQVLTNAGFDGKAIHNNKWMDLDAITVCIDVPEKRLVWVSADEVGNQVNHASVFKQIMAFRMLPWMFNIENGNNSEVLLEPNEKMERNLVEYPNGAIHGINFTGKEDLSAYLAMANWATFGTRDIPGFIMARYWTKTRFISFWQGKSEVLKSFGLVEKFLKSVGVRPTKVAYQFIDIDKVFLYDELFQEDDEKYKLSPEEILDLQKKQHLDANAKKKLAQAAGTMKQKVSPGFDDAQARRDAAMPALQEIVKLFNIAK